MMLEQGEMTVDDLLASDEEVDFGEDDEEDADADLDGGRDQHQAETARQQGEGIGRSNSRQQPRGSPDTATLAAAEEASRAKKADAISWAKWKGDTAADDTKGASNKENGRHDSRTADKRKSADKRGSDRAARRRSRSRTRSGSRQRDRLRPRSPVRELALRRRSPPSAYGSPLGHYSGYPSDYRGPPPPGYPGPPWHGSAGRHPYEPRPLPLRPLSPPRDLDYRGRPYYDDPYRERGPLPFPPDRQPSPPYGRERELSPPRSRYSPGHERVTRSGRLSPPPLFPSAQPKPDYDRYPRIDGRDRLPPPGHGPLPPYDDVPEPFHTRDSRRPVVDTRSRDRQPVSVVGRRETKRADSGPLPPAPPPKPAAERQPVEHSCGGQRRRKTGFSDAPPAPPALDREPIGKPGHADVRGKRSAEGASARERSRPAAPAREVFLVGDGQDRRSASPRHRSSNSKSPPRHAAPQEHSPESERNAAHLRSVWVPPLVLELPVQAPELRGMRGRQSPHSESPSGRPAGQQASREPASTAQADPKRKDAHWGSRLEKGTGSGEPPECSPPEAKKRRLGSVISVAAKPAALHPFLPMPPPLLLPGHIHAADASMLPIPADLPKPMSDPLQPADPKREGSRAAPGDPSQKSSGRSSASRKSQRSEQPAPKGEKDPKHTVLVSPAANKRRCKGDAGGDCAKDSGKSGTDKRQLGAADSGRNSKLDPDTRSSKLHKGSGAERDSKADSKAPIQPKQPAGSKPSSRLAADGTANGSASGAAAKPSEPTASRRQSSAAGASPDGIPPPPPVDGHANAAGARTSPPASAITARERQALEREQQKEWYYVDPQGKTQGPCAIAQFRKWLHLLKSDPARQAQYVEFGEVMAWRKGMPTGTKLLTLTQ